ncbi:MAG: hypothetical protein JJU40_10740, partial [Rhodobacteraceae bacterium]|nr:hypothetical protein [Paracoccaceae bacterium]
RRAVFLLLNLHPRRAIAPLGFVEDRPDVGEGRAGFWCLRRRLGGRGCLAPLTTALMGAARSDPGLRSLPEGSSDDEIAVIFARAIAQRAILDWEGVGDAEGKPAPVTPEGIAALLDIWPIFERFQLGYVAKALELEREKNASAPSPHGSGAGARAIARPARKAAKTARQG